MPCLSFLPPASRGRGRTRIRVSRSLEFHFDAQRGSDALACSSQVGMLQSIFFASAYSSFFLSLFFCLSRVCISLTSLPFASLLGLVLPCSYFALILHRLPRSPFSLLYLYTLLFTPFSLPSLPSPPHPFLLFPSHLFYFL